MNQGPPTAPRATSPRLAEKLRAVRHVALDMDGTIYSGGTLFSCTLPFLEKITSFGIGFTFLTNNPSKSAGDYLSHLHRLGLPATSRQLYTSAQATIDFLKSRHPEWRRLYLLGTPSMVAEFAAADFIPVEEKAPEPPDAVVVAFDLTLTYTRLCRAAWWVKQGKPFFATNPDRTCPTDQPTVLVDCGSICAAIEEATGRSPIQVFGKPDPSMLSGIQQQNGLESREIAMVGDRLYTDIAMARAAGALGVLVLTGETTLDAPPEELAQADVVVPSLAELGALLAQVRASSQVS